MTDDDDLRFKHAKRIALGNLARQLFGTDPDGDITGAVLGELFAQWMSNHSPTVREEVRKEWNKLVDGLIPAFDKARERRWPMQ
jgi:hypothetical protein